MANSYSLEEKKSAISDVKALVENGTAKTEAVKKVADAYKVHHTTIYSWMANGKDKPKSAKTVKAKPKRRTAKKPATNNGTKPVSIDALLKEYKQTLARAVEIRKQIDNEIDMAVNS